MSLHKGDSEKNDYGTEQTVFLHKNGDISKKRVKKDIILSDPSDNVPYYPTRQVTGYSSYFGSKDNPLGNIPGHYLHSSKSERSSDYSLYSRQTSFPSNLDAPNHNFFDSSQLYPQESSSTSSSSSLYGYRSTDTGGSHGGNGGGNSAGEDTFKWLQEPPREVVFSNSTGGVVNCQVEGASPPPRVLWTFEDGTAVREVRRSPNLRYFVVYFFISVCDNTLI